MSSTLRIISVIQAKGLGSSIWGFVFKKRKVLLHFGLNFSVYRQMKTLVRSLCSPLGQQGGRWEKGFPSCPCSLLQPPMLITCWASGTPAWAGETTRASTWPRPHRERKHAILPVAWAAPIILPRINPSRFAFLMTLIFVGRDFWTYSSSSPFKSSEKQFHSYSNHETLDNRFKVASVHSKILSLKTAKEP